MKKIFLVIILLIYNIGFSQKLFNLPSYKGQFKAIQFNNSLIYMEIGDSNAGGPVLESGSLDVKYQTSDRVRIFYKPDLTITDNGYWELYNTRSSPINRRPGLVTGSYAVGADQALVYDLTQATMLPRDLRYYKLGIGGTTLLALSGSDNDWRPTGGELFNTFVDNFVRIGLRKLANEGFRNPKFKGVIVRLGTNDCLTTQWNQAAFLAAVPEFVSVLRAKLGEPNLPIYWVQVRSDLASAPSGLFSSTAVTQCRQILTDCASGGATPISGFTLLNYDSDPIQADGVHYTEAAFLTQGASEAAIFISNGL